MHTIDLKNFSLRTDLIMDSDENEKLQKNSEKFRLGEIQRGYTADKTKNYVTISFSDITDKDNYQTVLDVFIKELEIFIKKLKLEETDAVLVIGLGNSRSTPDALGPLVIDNILVTKYLFTIGDVEKGYQNVCAFKPDVTGVTGIETIALINSVVKVSDAKCVIVIDALAASSVNRVNKIIQITDTGVHPGSGVSNNRGEVSKDTLGIPVIAIGVPTIVDANTIVAEALEKMDDYFEKKKVNIMGKLGELEKEEFKQLIDEIFKDEYNLMVTPKEVDFIIEKLGLLIGNGINKSLHKNLKRQNNYQ